MSRKVKVDDIERVWNTKTSRGGPVKDLDFPKKPGMQGSGDNTRLLKVAPEKSVLTNVNHQRKLVIVESPYSSEDPTMIARHVWYAKQCLLDSLHRGEAAFAGQLLYPQVLDDRVALDHDIGYSAHLSWLVAAELVAIYADYGISPGMQAAINTAKIKMIRVEYRLLGKVVGAGGGGDGGKGPVGGPA